MATINRDKLKRIRNASLEEGGGALGDAHLSLCVMQMVAWLADEEDPDRIYVSDHPACACPVLTDFMISWNDTAESQRARNKWLKPFIPRLVGSRAKGERIAARRKKMIEKWLRRYDSDIGGTGSDPITGYAAAAGVEASSRPGSATELMDAMLRLTEPKKPRKRAQKLARKRRAARPDIMAQIKSMVGVADEVRAELSKPERVK